MVAKNHRVACGQGRFERLVPVLPIWACVVLIGLGSGACPDGRKGGGTAESNQVGEGRRPEPALEDVPVAQRSHPAFAERLQERREMVDRQIAARQVKDANVLAAMRTVPRHAFIPPQQQRYAYGDHPLPIDQGQTISQPYIVAFMTEALKLDASSTVLEIGTGSGYQAAVAAEIAQTIYTIEIVESLAASAAERLSQLGYDNVHVRAGDGYYGWPQKGPFDAIIGTAAADRIPTPLIEQLKAGGRMILPVGGPLGLQYLILITKDQQGRIHKDNVMPVRFVPMTGEVQQVR